MLRVVCRSFSSRSVNVVLLQDRENIGIRGQSVAVKPGFARNFLIPEKVAVYATQENKNTMQQELDMERLKDLNEKKLVLRRLKNLQEQQLKFKRHAVDGVKLHGSVSERNIYDELVKAGAVTQNGKIKLISFEPLKTVGSHTVKVLFPDLPDAIDISVSVEKR